VTRESEYARAPAGVNKSTRGAAPRAPFELLARERRFFPWVGDEVEILIEVEGAHGRKEG
jgi:hypothetical protein